MPNDYKQLSVYIKKLSKVLIVLADEIKSDKKLTKDSEELLSKIGADLLFTAKSYTFISRDNN
ncbi:MAG: hypothetical protein EOL97_16425 [Spirochaetia bacterium]|nr:hypothetical protein [Spirochaetia bacterium]